MAEPTFFVGAWQRRSITVPGADPVEPCDARWVQTSDWFVDVRVARRGHEYNTLPYSQTRAFGGRFEIADGEVRWHLLLDTAGLVPHTDRAAEGGLYLAPDDPHLMIEDAPGRFVEEWVRADVAPTPVAVVHATDIRIAVVVGDVRAAIWREGSAVRAEVLGPHGLHVAIDGAQTTSA